MSRDFPVDGKQPKDEGEGSPDTFVAEIMDHEAELAAAPEPTVKRRSPLPVFVGLIVIFSALLVWNIVRIVHDPPVFTDAELEDDALFVLFVTSQGIEDYWDSARTLPSSLEALELDEEGVRYSRLSDSTYILTFTIGATELVYRRGEDIARFATAADVLGGEMER